MKKFFVIAISLVLTSLYINAQDVTWGMVKTSVEKNDKDIENPKKSISPKTWIERERVYTRLYTFDIAGIYLGMPESEVTLTKGQPKEKRTEKEFTVLTYDRLDLYFKDGALSKIGRIDELRKDPLLTSVEALKKAYEVDEKKKLTGKIVERLNEIKGAAYMRSVGSQYYADGDYDNCLKYFEAIVSINELPYVNAIDTSLLNDCGVVGKIAGKKDVAIKYFTKAADLKYGGTAVFIELYKLRKEAGDTLAALEELQKGIDAYPTEAIDLINELINVYIQTGKDQLAMDYLSKAIEKEPKNATYLFALGTLYDKKKESEKAVELYKKAIEIDSKFVDAYLNLGASYYNTGIELYKKASEPGNKSYQKDEDKAKEYYKQAIPFLVKVKEIAEDTQTKRDALNTLKTIYYRLGMNAEYKAVKSELDSL